MAGVLCVFWVCLFESSNLQMHKEYMGGRELKKFYLHIICKCAGD